MRKKISFCLAIVMILMMMVPSQAMAQYDQELESLIKKAKTLFQIGDGYDNFHYYMNKQNNKTFYNLSWSDSKGILGGINVEMDSAGSVRSYYSDKPYRENQQRKLPVISRQEGLAKADGFLQRINPAWWGRVTYEPEETVQNINDRYYSYRYTRIENGVLFPQDYLYVSINNETSEIEHYHSSWIDEAVFPKPEDTIGIELGQKAYAEKLGLKLAYKLSYNDEQNTPYLAFVSVYSGQMIDAETGEVLKQNLNYSYDRGGMAVAEEEKMAEGASSGNVVLSPQEKEAVEGIADLISEQKAEEIGRTALKMDSSYQLMSMHIYADNSNKGEYFWNLGFRKEEKKNGQTESSYGDITIDAKTGEIMSFYKGLPYHKDAKPQYDEKQTLEIAKKYIQKLQPEKFSQVEKTDWSAGIVRPLTDRELPTAYTFQFTRKSNSAYFLDNGFHVTVDTATGEITNYRYTWYKGQLPSANGVLSTQQAHEILFEEIGLQLQYVTYYAPEAEMKIMPIPAPEGKQEMKLVYTTKNNKPLNIDAKTGKLLDYAGKPYEPVVASAYSDIEGNFAQKQIEVLAAYGIALPGNTFEPNKNITQREFLYLIAKANGYTSYDLKEGSKIDEKLYADMKRLGVIREGEQAPQAAISREDAVKFIIRAMKYDKVAEIQKDIFVLPFQDGDKISKELYGYVALAYGLNLVDDSGDPFHPAANLTRAQAAVWMYNYLSIY